MAFGKYLYIFLMGIWLRVELLGQRVYISSDLVDIIKDFFKLIVINTPISSVGEFLLLCIFSNTWYCLLFHVSHYRECVWYYIAILFCISLWPTKCGIFHRLIRHVDVIFCEMLTQIFCLFSKLDSFYLINF